MIKVATVTYKILHTDRPSYLNELIDFCEPVYQLRTSVIDLELFQPYVVLNIPQ